LTEHSTQALKSLVLSVAANEKVGTEGGKIYSFYFDFLFHVMT